MLEAGRRKGSAGARTEVSLVANRVAYIVGVFNNLLRRIKIGRAPIFLADPDHFLGAFGGLFRPIKRWNNDELSVSNRDGLFNYEASAFDGDAVGGARIRR